MPPHQNQVNFDLYIKTNSISTHRFKQIQFRYLIWRQVKFDPQQKSSQSRSKP